MIADYCNVAMLQCTDSRFSNPLPELPLEIWQMNILQSYFTSLFVIEDGKFHASDLEGVSAESFVINGYKKGNMLNGFDDIDYLKNIEEEITTFAGTRPF